MMETAVTHERGVRVHQRCLTAVVALGLLVLPGRWVAAQSPTAAKGQATTPLKTSPRLLRSADGRPDLRGMWSYSDPTPLERPAKFAGRDKLSPEEAASFDQERAAAGG